MSSGPIEVALSDSEIDRSKIDKILTEFLPQIATRLARESTTPLLICVGVAAECGVLAKAIVRSDVCSLSEGEQVSSGVADVMKKKVFGMKNLRCSAELDDHRAS